MYNKKLTERFAYIEFAFPSVEMLAAICESINSIRDFRERSSSDPSCSIDEVEESVSALILMVRKCGRGSLDEMPHDDMITYFDQVSKSCWDLASVIYGFIDGDYELISCKAVSPGIGRLEFNPLGFPYGGMACMRVLVQMFGGSVVAENDWTRPRRNVV